MIITYFVCTYCAERRSIGIENESAGEEKTPEVEEDTEVDGIIATEFNLTDYLSHIKKHHRKRQTSKEKDYVLFILDSSGSILKHNFETMKKVAAKLSNLFCNAKVAVMAYSTLVYREVCFNCEQSIPGAVHDAIYKVKYKNKRTATGDAIRCACNQMLNTPCGFQQDNKNPPSVAVLLVVLSKSAI